MKVPQALINSLQNIQGFNESTFIKAHENEVPPISIRINPFKNSEIFSDAEPIVWSNYGKYLANRSDFSLNPLYHAGTFFVQEASSMYLEQVLKSTVDLSQDLKVLDLCAAPGGTSTLIASLITPDSLLICNDVIQTRSNHLSDNLTKWGTMNTIVTNNDPKDFMRLFGFFDVLLIDAPSSSSGLFRKDPNILKEWSDVNVNSWALKQKKMISDAWSSLKQGGILIYSTSSYSKEENEEIVDWIESTFNAEHLTAKNTDILGGEIISEGSFRLFPDQVKGEGFFITAFKKKSSEKEVFIRSGKPIKNNNRRTEREILRHWIKDIDDHTWFEKDGEYFLVNPAHEHAINLITFNFNLRKVGTKIGKLSNKDLIPDHELAMSIFLSEKINKVEVSPEEANKYLRRDDFVLEEVVKGWSLITFKGFGLGWAKILPNRINNYYPKELRISTKEA
ncbi:RsmB/NOP family class I SAM-dependent RNA methyltransferase [Arcicella rosea]|uniref:16S rRNA C967 or C1407 C5-methylase (RsmB/RsmF family)/NOL1/NOP2/fmu family ribosome biogenesis protein n=1 Tax=Arcicella rosea TaxID=502909 RepID=A0A841EVY8_9BACT|nr:RsmB/NOP family class I SAM-dependent RNA methyltransferase [Arcicella rosea]MBB6003631.1 16S rRNA C967 or C1407 C5-methylase (RsmB/RsmF family)/NOL1/NOP2/fmu family ribosome biogenesis protein [Arcicella rosea]